MRQPSDSAVRDAAIDPRRSFLIQAPAGSGKTELLTDRILALLATVNRPEEIVAITFTRKAASEMHKRVLDKLRDGREDNPPKEPHKQRGWELARQALARDKLLGWNLLDYPARLGIRTIDSFCAYLVRAMPWMSGLGGMPAMTDSPAEHYEAAAQATLAMADENEAVAELIAHLDVDVKVARDLLAGMLASRDQWLPLLGRGADNEQLLESLARAVEDDLRRLGSAMPVGWASALAPCLSKAAETLAANGEEASPLLDWDGQPFDTDMDCLPQWQAFAQAMLTAKGTLRRTVTKKQGFEAGTPHKKEFLAWLSAVPDNEAWIGILNDIRSAPCGGYTEEQQHVLAVLLEVLWLAAAQLKLRFAEAAEVDFTEISQRAIEALGRVDDPSDLLLSLDGAIRHILVDEFQDTSQTQIRLLELLTAGWMEGDGHTLFLVGDPMQSIYRFRKADVGGFLNVRDHGLGEVSLTALELKENFRSQGNLVEWVNTTCQPIFPRENHPGLGAITFTRSVAFNDPVQGVSAQFHPVWVRKSKDEDQDNDAFPDGSDGEGIASGVGSVSASSDAQALGEESAEGLAVRLAQEALAMHPESERPVAILVRARGHLEGVVRRLARAGVPCRAVELVTLQSRQLVIDLAQLARALSHPADRLAWLSVLRSPLCGLKLSSLHALCGADLLTPVPRLLAGWLRKDGKDVVGGGVNADADVDARRAWAERDTGAETDQINHKCDMQACLPPDEARRLRLAAAVLLDDSNAAGTVPFAAWLERCWQRLGGPEVYYRSASDAADAERLFRLIEDIAPYGQLDPVDLEQRLEKLFAAPESGERAVEVMTLHKSKGLEFETVIMTGLHRRPRTDTAPLMYFEPHGDELLLGPIKHRVTAEADPVTVYLAEREKKRAAYETDRLLYVGLTRAKHQLHLIGEVVLDEGMKPKKPAGSSLLGRLWDQLIVPEGPELGAGSNTPDSDVDAAIQAATQDLNVPQSVSSGRPAGRFLVRRRLEALPPEPVFGAQDSAALRQDAPPGLKGPGAPDIQGKAPGDSARSAAGGIRSAAPRPARAAVWQWREASGDEAVIGTVAHAWLERIGKEGADAWPAARIDECLPVFHRQLARAGLPDASLDGAAEALRDTLASTLASERGQWLLRVAQAHREWTLLDISGRVSVIDLAISQENDWLVVDYKTGKPHPGESADVYAARMRERYREQIERYCAHVTALDGRPARGALYFPRADIWVDYPVQGAG